MQEETQTEIRFEWFSGLSLKNLLLKSTSRDPKDLRGLFREDSFYLISNKISNFINNLLLIFINNLLLIFINNFIFLKIGPRACLIWSFQKPLFENRDYWKEGYFNMSPFQ